MVMKVVFDMFFVSHHGDNADIACFRFPFAVRSPAGESSMLVWRQVWIKGLGDVPFRDDKMYHLAIEERDDPTACDVRER